MEIHFPFWLMEELTEKAVDWNPSVGTINGVGFSGIVPINTPNKQIICE